MSVKLYHRKFKASIKDATAEGLIRAGAFYHTACRQAVNKSNPLTFPFVNAKNKQGLYTFKKKRDTTRKKGYYSPSLPGEPPRARTGFGRDNIVFEYNDNPNAPAVRVGITKNAVYMWFLELGTRFIGKRPWLVATLFKHRAKIARLAAIGGRGKIPGQ